MSNSTSGQSFKNHARFFPLFHFFALPILLVNAVWSLYRAFVRPAWETALAGLVAVALVAAFLSARTFALTVLRVLEVRRAVAAPWHIEQPLAWHLWPLQPP